MKDNNNILLIVYYYAKGSTNIHDKHKNNLKSIIKTLHKSDNTVFI